MKRWRAPIDPAAFVFLGAAIVCVVLGVIGALRVIEDLRGSIDQWPISLNLFALALGALVSLVAAGVLLQRLINRVSLIYELDRNAIYVRRRDGSYIIPLDQVIGLTPASQPTEPSTKPSIRFGRGRATQTLLVETQRSVYHLAIRERNAFAREVQARRQLGVVQLQREGPIDARSALHVFLASPTIQRLIVIGLLINLALWMLLTWRFPALPETVPVRFDPLGGTAGARPRSYTLLLPSVGSLILLSNTLLAGIGFRRSRLASELLLLGALIVELVALVAGWFTVTGVQ